MQGSRLADLDFPELCEMRVDALGFFGHQEVGEAEATVFLGEVRFVEQVQKLPQMDRLGARGVNTGWAAGPLELGAQA